MSLLEFKRTGPAAYGVSDGLGALWDEAERLGRVSLKTETFSGPRYEAQIWFKRPSGSNVWASGKHDDRDQALRLAIEEAKAIGGSQQEGNQG